MLATHHLEPMEPSELEAYIVHRLGVVGWQGRPRFEADAFSALYSQTDGIPRRVNQLASRLMLAAALEDLDVIDAATVDAVAADMAADVPQRQEERFLPLRTASAPAPQPARPDPVRDLAVERRLAALEIRLEEQEVALRRILTLMVDWVENGQQAPSYRHNAA